MIEDAVQEAKLGLVASVRRLYPGVSPLTERSFSVVERHRFVPRVLEADIADPDSPALGADSAPGAKDALAIVYSNAALLTHADSEGKPLSSSTMPTVMARMLDALDLAPGMDVLEIGAGTGYNAALIAEGVGDSGRVVSVDSREEVANEARSHLRDAGYGDVAVIPADGFGGYPPAAPYDRIIVTVGCGDVSPHWLGQLKDDGVVVVPLEHGGMHPLVRLVRDGSTRGSGRFVGWTKFMQADGAIPHEDIGAERCRPSDAEWTELEWDGPDRAQFLDFWFFCLLAYPRAGFVTVRNAPGAETMTGAALVSADDGVVMMRPDRLTGWGPARLWATAGDALAHWRQLEEPRLLDYRISVQFDDEAQDAGVVHSAQIGSHEDTWIVPRAMSTQVVSLPRDPPAMLPANEWSDG